jgi:hypothetical protein
MTLINLSLSLDEDEETVDRDTRRLLPHLLDSVDRNARIATGPAEENTRAALETALLGQIALTLVSSGTVVAMLEILKAYFNRKRSGKFTMTRPDGASVSIELDDVSDEQFDKTVDRIFVFSAGQDP